MTRIARLGRMLPLLGLLCLGAPIGLLHAAEIPPIAVPAFPVERGPWTVGYRTQLTHDAGRSFGPRIELGGTVHQDLRSRPVRVHLWYPAIPGSSSPMRYGDFVVAANVSDSRSDAEAREVPAAYKAPLLDRDADDARLDDLLAAETRSFRDLEPERGPFPLIVYAPSINAESCENAHFFEFLASHGFVVASSACQGVDEPVVSRDLPGALAQLGDVQHVLRWACEESFVDDEHVGLMGFSWGGTSVLLLALQHAGIDAVVTLDGGYGFPRYRSIPEATPWWVPRDLRAAFCHVTPLGEERDFAFASETRYAETWGRRVTGFTHADFATDAILGRRWAAGDSAAAGLLQEHAAIQHSVLSFFSAYCSADTTAAARLRREAAAGAASGWEMRPALPTPPTAAHFDQIIAQEGVDAAVAVFHEARRIDAGVVIFGEERLNRHAAEWGPDRAEELWKLLAINAEAWPRSAETRYALLDGPSPTGPR